MKVRAFLKEIYKNKFYLLHDSALKILKEDDLEKYKSTFISEKEKLRPIIHDLRNRYRGNKINNVEYINKKETLEQEMNNTLFERLMEILELQD